MTSSVGHPSKGVLNSPYGSYARKHTMLPGVRNVLTQSQSTHVHSYTTMTVTRKHQRCDN